MSEINKPVDWAEIKRIQDEGYPEMQHLDPCICTQGPHGVIIDYDCGRRLASNPGCSCGEADLGAPGHDPLPGQRQSDDG